MSEVRSLNPNFNSAHVRGKEQLIAQNCNVYLICTVDAAYRYYRTKKEADTNDSKGKGEHLKTNKRRHERIVRVS